MATADKNKTPSHALFGACVAVCVLAVMLVVITYLVTRKAWKRFNTPKKELLDLVNDSAQVITTKNVKEMVAKVVKLPPVTEVESEQKEVSAYLATIADPWESQASAQGKLENVSGARDGGKLPILKETRATLGTRTSNLHVSKLQDLYGNPLFLSAAPLPAQFADHWELIWRENIGVIVWVGRLATADGIRMEAYISLEKGKEVSYGPFKVQTTRCFDRILRLAAYELSVTREGSKRTVVVVHAYEWLQDSVPWALRREVEVILNIKDAHLRQLVANQPGVMFQCKWGTAGSAAVCAVYIGFQTWLRCKKVNMHGIIKYVRRNRWKAFEETGQASHAFIVQVQVAYTVMYALTTFIEKKKLAAFDEWLQGILGSSRRAGSSHRA